MKRITKLISIFLILGIVSMGLCACTTSEQAREKIDKSSQEYQRAKDKLDYLQDELEDVQNQIDSYK